KNQKTLLSHAEEQRIVDTFNAREAVEDFSVVVDYDAIAAKNYSLSAGQYFEVKIEYCDLTPSEFSDRIAGFNASLSELFQQSKALEESIAQSMSQLAYEA